MRHPQRERQLRWCKSSVLFPLAVLFALQRWILSSLFSLANCLAHLAHIGYVACLVHGW